jgi:hypothetical protein
LGSTEGNGFFDGSKSLKLMNEASRVLFIRARAKEGFEKGLRSSRRRKALKGKAQECWGLKYLPKDSSAKSSQRG